MAMSKPIETGMLACALALAALACTKEVTAGSPAASGDTASVTSHAPASVAKLPTSTVARKSLPAVQPLPSGSRPDPATGEAPATPPSPAVLEAVNATQTKLVGLTTGVDGTKVRFVDCTASAACTTRLEAQTLTGLRDLLQAVSGQQGGINFVAREQLDGYTGHSFVADVTLGGTSTRPVPTDENELLGNNGDGT
jgi:predicted component of type VI protein secretion system